jgi:transcription elongation factor/antiterminator RfaH
MRQNLVDPGIGSHRGDPAAGGRPMSTAMSIGERRWFAVLTLPNREAQAALQLKRQDFAAYLPLRLKSVRHARRTETRLKPLFPRYLFVDLDTSRARWRSINGTFGVAHLVSFGEAPTPVPVGVVESLLAMSDGAGVVRFEDHLQPGNVVRLAAGPFAEQLGVLARLDGADAVRVLLELMGRSVEVRAPRHLVLPAA